ncbi:hypothetical protein C8Q73DRAFT_497622 [Cubamyces lactineus]|nr:hypothetical protein C8Q73DRAFT_497622 [Cubamyces lactineus]
MPFCSRPACCISVSADGGWNKIWRCEMCLLFIYHCSCNPWCAIASSRCETKRERDGACISKQAR